MHYTRVSFGLVFALFSMALSGCSLFDQSPSGESPKILGMHLERLESLRGGLNEFERSVLDDNWVTDEEWNDASTLFHHCLAEQELEGFIADDRMGFGFTPEQQQSYLAKNPEANPSHALDKMFSIASGCGTGTIEMVGVFYFEPRANPEGVSDAELIRRCFVKVGRSAEIAGLDDEGIFDYFYTLAYEDQPEVVQGCLTYPSY